MSYRDAHLVLGAILQVQSVSEPDRSNDLYHRGVVALTGVVLVGPQDETIDTPILHGTTLIPMPYSGGSIRLLSAGTCQGQSNTALRLPG